MYSEVKEQRGEYTPAWLLLDTGGSASQQHGRWGLRIWSRRGALLLRVHQQSEATAVGCRQVERRCSDRSMRRALRSSPSFNTSGDTFHFEYVSQARFLARYGVNF